MENNHESKQIRPVGLLEKAPTYIPGLDDILDGGLPRGRTTVIKALMGLEFLYRCALAGEPGLFIRTSAGRWR